MAAKTWYKMPSVTAMKKYEADGLCSQEVCVLHNIGYQSIAKYCRKAGVQLAHKKYSTGRQKRYDELVSLGYPLDDAKKIASLYGDRQATQDRKSKDKQFMRVVKRVNLKKVIASFQKNNPVMVRAWKGNAFGDML